MVTLLMLTLLQTPVAPPQPTPAPAAPTQTKPRPAVAATTTMNLFVTDGSGVPVEGVTVTATGPVDREAKALANGVVRLTGLRAGTYRLRFSQEGFYTFEKEVAWRAGQPAPEVAVTLNAAPPPPPPPPPPPLPPVEPPAPKLPPRGEPKSMQLPDYIERNFISSREPHKENIVGCSGVGQAVVWQVREPWEGRKHESADVMLYFVGGEGSLKLAASDISVTAGSFAVVPRGTTYGFVRRGRNPLIILAVLAGAPCAAN